MFAYAEFSHNYKTILTFVKVVELTHEKSANKRAIIEYECDGEIIRHYIPRSRLIVPTLVHSEILYYVFVGGFKYCIEGRADFFKHPDEHFVSMVTKFVITELKVNSFKMADIKEAAEFMNIELNQLDRQIHAKFVEYADELPF